MHDVELYVIVDENGDYAVHVDRDELAQEYADEIGGDGPTRIICVKLSVPPPRMIVVNATVPEQPSEAVVSVS